MHGHLNIKVNKFLADYMVSHPNVSKYLADYMVSHPNVSNLHSHSHCHLNLKSVSLPCLQLSLLLLQVTIKNCSMSVKLLGSMPQDGVPGTVHHYSRQERQQSR